MIKTPCSFLVFAFFLSGFAQSEDRISPVSDWYQVNDLARSLSQLTDEEVSFLDGSDLIHHRPVALPIPDLVVTGNDYYDWPIATMIGDTIIVLFDRRHFHWGKDLGEPLMDENSGIRMVVRSPDRGRTWLPPVDLLDGKKGWERPLFGGWGGGLGVHEGIVYLAINEGVFASSDEGESWDLIHPTPDFTNIPTFEQPPNESAKEGDNIATNVAATFWSPGMRMTFDDAHGLSIWTTRGFKPSGRDAKTNSHYGKFLCAISTADGGATWNYEEQPVPDGIFLSEITPLQHEGGLTFFLRNGIQKAFYAQAHSSTGWFPFDAAITNVGPMDYIDTPDVIFNPITGRLEAAVTRRTYRDSGEPMELQLYSIDPEAFAGGETQWKFEGVLLRYRDAFGASDGMNPVAGVVDEENGVHRIYIWGGNPQEKSGIFELSRSLDTGKLSDYLKSQRTDTTSEAAAPN